MALIWALCSFCSRSVPSCAGSPSLVYCTEVFCCNRWCDPLRWVSFNGALCGGLCVSSVCLLCVRECAQFLV